MSSSNPYRTSKSESSSRRKRGETTGSMLMLGTICLLLPVVIQVMEIRNLASNPLSMIGLPIVGIVSIGTAFSFYRLSRDK